jgi:hypothetical protein
LDGTLAVIYLITALTEMGYTHCPAGCVAARDTAPRLSFQTGAVEFQDRPAGEEIYLEYALPTAYGPFQPVAAVSVTSDESAWLGFGLRSEVPLWDTDLVYEGSLIPGYHDPGNGPDLGGALQFRGSFGLAYDFGNDVRIGLYYDHRSNADTQALNPGLETYGLRVSIPLD